VTITRDVAKLAGFAIDLYGCFSPHVPIVPRAGEKGNGRPAPLAEGAIRLRTNRTTGEKGPQDGTFSTGAYMTG